MSLHFLLGDLLELVEACLLSAEMVLMGGDLSPEPVVLLLDVDVFLRDHGDYCSSLSFKLFI